MSVGYDVERFMKAIGQTGPVDDEKRLIASRISLIDEKYDELIQALNWGDRTIIAQTSGDMVYVIVGACVALNIPFDDVWAALHDSNMSRLDEDGKVIKNEDGKILQGPNYKGPEKRIEQLVRQS